MKNKTIIYSIFKTNSEQHTERRDVIFEARSRYTNQQQHKHKDKTNQID